MCHGMTQPHPTTKPRVFLTVVQAAALLTCSVRTMERKLAAGLYRVEFDNKGRRLVDMTEEAERQQTDAQALQSASWEARKEASQLAQVVTELTTFYCAESKRLHEEADKLRHRAFVLTMATAASVGLAVGCVVLVVAKSPNFGTPTEAHWRQSDNMTESSNQPTTPNPTGAAKERVDTVTTSATPTAKPFDIPFCLVAPELGQRVTVDPLESTRVEVGKTVRYW